MAKSSRLDQFKPKIVSLLNEGWTVSRLAAHFNTTFQSMRNWLRRQGLCAPGTKRVTRQTREKIALAAATSNHSTSKSFCSDTTAGIPVQTSFGTIYLARAEKLPPIAREPKPVPGTCHCCHKNPIARNHHRLCYRCHRFADSSPGAAVNTGAAAFNFH